AEPGGGGEARARASESDGTGGAERDRTVPLSLRSGVTPSRSVSRGLRPLVPRRRSTVRSLPGSRECGGKNSLGGAERDRTVPLSLRSGVTPSRSVSRGLRPLVPRRRSTVRSLPGSRECGGKNSLGGAERDRTVDLLNAIQALSQLSYSPTRWARRIACR